MKKTLSTVALAALIGLGVVAASASGASAYIACNGAGECWHTDHRDHFRGQRFDYHPDDWYFHRDWNHDGEHHWRDYHEGRGYYSNGVWTPR